MTDQPRPVWLTTMEIYGVETVAELRALLLAKYDAAPADPAEAVRDALEEQEPDHLRDAIRIGLRALGMPDA